MAAIFTSSLRRRAQGRPPHLSLPPQRPTCLPVYLSTHDCTCIQTSPLTQTDYAPSRNRSQSPPAQLLTSLPRPCKHHATPTPPHQHQPVSVPHPFRNFLTPIRQGQAAWQGPVSDAVSAAACSYILASRSALRVYAPTLRRSSACTHARS
ncbi:hypothetical protein BS50DRAFT_574978 [Corynespora cassiicola Philippines]|uniref:Uncharacterized protein n=1 Tax=Corynespora cassiicola Philippines TaxID=1448308 RepID=A0A2T2NHB0_CORCC|nr:hypothetical protein BS50DRAFT_574978 [Corynespora cassiicola Philippines]